MLNERLRQKEDKHACGRVSCRPLITRKEPLFYLQVEGFQAGNSKSLEVLQKEKVPQPWITECTSIYIKNGHMDYCSQIELKD